MVQKIGVIGLGFVGDAMYSSFTQKKQEATDNGQDSFELVGYDKYKYGGIGTLESMLDCDLVFLCLPTLFCPKRGTYNTDALHEVCSGLMDGGFKGLVIVKSTIEPQTCETLAKTYNLHVVHNPEFLTARTAREDFHHQKHIVLGTTSGDYYINTLTTFYEKYYPAAEISDCTAIESECMKICVNSFYAVKVQMMNEIYLLCQKVGANYDRVTEMMLKNGWIHPMHCTVPGPDGQLSYGGACFPKDTQALRNFMKNSDVPCAVLDACITERNSMRQD